MSLPEPWEYAPLNSVAHVEMGQSPPSNTYNEEGNGLPFFQGKAEFGKLYPEARKWCSVPNKIAEPNDILLSIRAPVGPTNLALERCCIGRGLAAIRAIPPLDQKYLLYHFRNIESWLSQQGTGSTFTAISGGFVRELSVPIAPINEQKRIADKLDNLLGRVDTCREHLDRVPQILKRFRQSVLAAATSGELTKDWRESRLANARIILQDEIAPPDNAMELPYGWFWTCPEYLKAKERYALAIGPFGSNLTVKDYKDSGVPIIFVRDIRGRVFGNEKTKFVTLEKAEELIAHSVSGGDLLITKMGDPPGDTALYPLDAPDAIITSDCIKLRLDPSKALAKYISYVIESPAARERLLEITAGVAQQKVSLERFKWFPLQLAPVDEQIEIVRRVETLFAYADGMDEHYKAALERVEKLTPSTLDKAFRGELVPQNPNDEPASKLLKRIQSDRAITPKPAKAKRTKKLSLSGEVSAKSTVTGHATLTTQVPTSHGRAVVQIERNHPDVKGKPYLANILKGIGGHVDAKYLYDQSGLNLVDFYKQLAEEFDKGWIKDYGQRVGAK